MADAGFDIKLRIHTETLESNIKRILGKKKKLALSDDVKEFAVDLYSRKIKPYVPRKTGNLRNKKNTKIVRYKGTYAIDYIATDKYGRQYAKAQYYADDSDWERTTEGTYSHWNQHLSRAEREDYYRRVAEKMKEKMKNG